MGGKGSGRTWQTNRDAAVSRVNYEADRRLGHIRERIKECRANQTEDQRYWLDLAEGGLLIAEETIREAIEKERLSCRQLGAIEYLYQQAVENRVRLKHSEEKAHEQAACEKVGNGE